jgi:hypothetical protein
VIFTLVVAFLALSAVRLQPSSVTTYVIRCLALLVGLLMVALAVGSRAEAMRRSTRPGRVPEVSEDYLEEIHARAAGMPLTAAQARVLALSLVKPFAVRDRVTESYTAEGRTLSHRVAIDFRVAPGYLRDGPSGEEEPPDGRYYLALLIPPKGELHDDFRIYAADGTPMPSVSYRRQLALVDGVLGTLLTHACHAAGEHADGGPPAATGLPEEVRRLQRRALALILRPGIPDRADPETERTIAELRAVADGDPLAQLAANLVETLVGQYGILVAVPLSPEGSVSLSYESRITPSDARQTGSGPADRVKRAIRRLLGARPVVVRVGIEKVWTCRSYHLQVTGPPGFYLGRQVMVPDPDAWFEAYGEWLAERRKEAGEGAVRRDRSAAPHYRFRRRLGQRYGHFYARDFPPPVPVPVSGTGSLPAPDTAGEPPALPAPEVRFSFYEVPPGSDFRASVAAIGAFLIIWLVGYVVSVRPGGAGHGAGAALGGDTAALLLALPGLMAVWVCLEHRAGRLMSRSLAALVSLFGTASLAMAAVGLLLLRNAGVGARSLGRGIPGDHALLGVDIISWAVVVVIALVNALMITYRWIVRSRIYDVLSARAPSGTAEAEERYSSSIPV